MSILRMSVMVGVVTLLARSAVGEGSAKQPSVRPTRIDVPGRAGLVYYPSEIVGNPESYQEYFEWIKQFRFCLGRTPVYFRDQHRVPLQQAGCLLLVRMPFGRINQPELARQAKDPTRRRRYDTYREICSHPDWLLNPGNPIARREEGPPSYFFDFGNAELRRCFARFIKQQVEETQYDGVFFDIMGGYGVPEAVQAMWNKKHPDLQYDEAAGQFVRELHEVLGDKLVGGNQAYKAWKCYFPHVDYDLRESVATSDAWGKTAQIYVSGEGLQTVRETFYRCWDGPDGYEASNADRRQGEIQHPHVESMDLNYILPRYAPTGGMKEVNGQKLRVYTRSADRPAICYSYVLARLSGRVPYACDVNSRTAAKGKPWTLAAVRSDLHFLDLGRPLEEDYRETETAVARYFENGFVVANREVISAAFTPNKNMIPEEAIGLWDAYQQKRLPDWPARYTITINPTYYPATKTLAPSGRVYLYMRKP